MLRKIFLCILLFILVGNISGRVQAADSSESAQTSSSYDMPYPGLLPDNPLYIIKTFRDKVISMLIADPKKRVEFDLLNSDKRLSSGVLLIQSKKYDLGITTISKSNNYFHESLATFQKIAASKGEKELIRLRLFDAAKKHKELLTGVKKNIPEKNHDSFEKEEVRLDEFLSSLSPRS